MSDAAFEEADEWAEDWLWNLSDVEKSDLRAAIGKAVDNWADKHGRQPAFWTCHNIRPAIVRCVAHDRGMFVFVTDADTQGSTANVVEGDREWLATKVAASFRKYERWKFRIGSIGLIVITIFLAAWMSGHG
jgi:hypothetical protein